jgi:hypothetical protein
MHVTRQMLPSNLPTKRQTECLKLPFFSNTILLSSRLLELRSEVIRNLPSQCVRLVSFLRFEDLGVDEFAQYIVDLSSIVIAAEDDLVVPDTFLIPILQGKQAMLGQNALVSAHEWLSFAVVHILKNRDDGLVRELDVDEEVYDPGAADAVVRNKGLNHRDED